MFRGFPRVSALALSRGASTADAVRYGAAAAGASCRSLTPGKLDPGDVERLLPLVEVEDAQGG